MLPLLWQLSADTLFFTSTFGESVLDYFWILSKLWLALTCDSVVLQRPVTRWLSGNYCDVFPILMLTAADAKCMHMVHSRKLQKVRRLACLCLFWR